MNLALRVSDYSSKFMGVPPGVYLQLIEVLRTCLYLSRAFCNLFPKSACTLEKLATWKSTRYTTVIIMGCSRRNWRFCWGGVHGRVSVSELEAARGTEEKQGLCALAKQTRKQHSLIWRSRLFVTRQRTVSYRKDQTLNWDLSFPFKSVFLKFRLYRQKRIIFLATLRI